MGDVAGDVVRLGLLLTLLGFALWVGGAFVAAWVGGEKGRDPIAWFVLAFFLSPLVALIALGAVPSRRPGWSTELDKTRRPRDGTLRRLR
jgi:hypothetical protein